MVRISKALGVIALALSANVVAGLLATCTGDPPDDAKEDIVIVERAGAARHGPPHVDAATPTVAAPAAVARR